MRYVRISLTVGVSLLVLKSSPIEHSLLVPHCTFVAVVPCLSQVFLGLKLVSRFASSAGDIGWQYVDIIFLQEGEDPLVVLERHLLRLRESLEVRHVSSPRPQAIENVLR
jgi:hypothetical protein